MFDWIEELRDLFAFSVMYMVMHEPLTSSFFPLLQVSAPAWLFNFFTLVWDRLPLIFIGAVIVRGYVKAQLREPRSQIERVPLL